MCSGSTQFRIVGYVTADIECLKEGDYVLSRDQHDPDGPLLAGRISRKYKRIADHVQIVAVEDATGRTQTLQTTDEHPFHVLGQGWTASKLLAAGDELSGPGETDSAVTSNARESHAGGVTVYNMEIEGSHSYFVRAEGAEGEPVWVHNAEYVTAKGQKPSNSPDPSNWVKKGGSVWNEMDGTWVYQDWEGNIVRYPNGFADFEGAGFVRQSAKIAMKGNHTTDYTAADAAAPLGPQLPENTWHHYQDLTTMQEVDGVIHARFTHRGGVSIINSKVK